MINGLREVHKTHVATLITVDSEGAEYDETYILQRQLKIPSKNTSRIRIKFLFHNKELWETSIKDNVATLITPIQNPANVVKVILM